MQVKHIMYKKVFTISADTSVYEATKLLDRHNVGSLLVEQHDVVIGIVTERDFIRKVLAKDKSPKRTSVRSIMSSPIIMINADADIIDAGKMLAKFKIKRLVVSDNGKIKGIISSTVIGNHIKKIIESY